MLGRMDARPLAGKRVLVLRPEAQARGTADALRARGAEPVVFPVIAITDPDDPDAVLSAVRDLARYDWVVFTSVNGVERCFAALERSGAPFSAVHVAAIGPETAQAVRARGHDVTLVAKKYVAEELARALLEHATPRRVLLLRARSAREVLPELLRAAGSEVDVVPVYDTRAVGPEQADAFQNLFRQGAVDVVLFTASSTVAAAVDLLGAEATALLSRVTVASIGPITGATLLARGIRPDVTASEHTLAGLLAALEAHLAAPT